MSPTRFIALAGCGTVLLALTGLALVLQQPDDIDAFLAVVLLQGTVYLAAVWLVWRPGSSRRVVLGIAAIAAIMRIPVAALSIAIMRSRDTAHWAFVPAALLATTFIVLVSPHYPWYFAWLIVFAGFIRSVALLWLTIACLLLYLVPVGSYIVRDDYRLAVESMIYGPFAALTAAELWYWYRHRAIRSS